MHRLVAAPDRSGDGHHGLTPRVRQQDLAPPQHERIRRAQPRLQRSALVVGNPSVEGYEVFFCSDEHTTFLAGDRPLPAVGDRLRMIPAHVDPTVALHERLHLVDGDEVIDTWPVDLRNW